MHPRGFEVRAYDPICKVAYAIASLADAGNIEEGHLMVAIQCGALDRSLWM
jgi:predicted ATPase with chaperone activity